MGETPSQAFTERHTTCNPETIRVLAIDDNRDTLDLYCNLFGQQPKHALTQQIDQLALLYVEEGEEIPPRPTAALPAKIELDTTTQGEQGAEMVEQAMAEQQPYSVILLDMRMPGGWDGLQTAQKIRELDPLTRIILITAYMDYTMPQLRSRLGVHFSYLQKPFDQEELLQQILVLGCDWNREMRLIEQEAMMSRVAEAAEAANRAKDRFLASMSHELRTPLTSLLGNCQLLGEQLLGDEQLSLLNSMEVSGKSLLYLVNDILDNSKIESGQFQIDEAPYNPVMMLGEIRQIFSSRAENKSILFQIHQDSPLERMWIGDGKRLGQVLVNLIGNAIKFTPEGSVSLTVRVDTAEETIHFIVEDTGIGMNEAVMERLFQPYEQGDHRISSRYGGTGLGLHISRNLVEQMEGTIEVSSEVDVGSRFEVAIPLKEGEAVQGIYTPGIIKLPPLYLEGRVLIVEDTPELQILERRLVEAYGVRVDIASDGAEALHHVTEKEYDLILMDMLMPVMDGLESTAAMRNMGVDIPIVALTANVMQQHRDEAQEAGCDGFLGKPIERIELRTVLKQYLIEAEDAAERSAEAEQEDSTISIDADLLALCIDRYQMLRKDLVSGIEVEDWDQIRKTAHTLKGSGSSFGFPQITTLGNRVLHAIREEDLEQAMQGAIELHSKLDQVISSA